MSDIDTSMSAVEALCNRLDEIVNELEQLQWPYSTN